MTDLAKLVVRLEAQTTQYQQQLDRAERRLKSFESTAGRAFGSIGTAARAQFGVLTAAVTGFSVVASVNKAIQLGDELDKAATKAGITGRAISELAYVAKQSDIELTTLSNAIRKMQVNLSEAATGGKAQQEALRALGIELKDIQGLAADRQFEVIGDRINQLKDPADRARAAVELFGKAGADLLPLFEQGAAGIRMAREEAQRLGRSFSDEQIKALADADRAIKQLKGSWEGFVTYLTAKAAPALSRFFDEWSARISGDQIGILKTEIDTLQRSIDKGGGTILTPFISMGAFGGAPDVEAGIYTLEEQVKKLAELKQKLAVLQSSKIPGGYAATAPGAAPIGFSAADAAIKAEEAAEKAREKAEKAAEARAARLAAMSDELAEVETANVREREDVWAQYYEELDDRTMTSTERQLAQFARIEAALVDLQEAGRISPEEFNLRWNAAFDDLVAIQEIDRVYDRIEARSEGLSAQQEQVYAGTIDFIANGIRGAFDGSFDDAIKGFQNMLLEMAIQAQAAQIGKWLFGSTGLGGEGGNFFKDILGGAGKAVMGLFGPGRAAGGPVSPGTLYPVNENTPKTEWFMPSTPGTIIPHEQVAGGMTVHNSFSIHAPTGSITRQAEQQIAAAASRGLMAASRRNN